MRDGPVGEHQRKGCDGGVVAGPHPGESSVCSPSEGPSPLPHRHSSSACGPSQPITRSGVLSEKPDWLINQITDVSSAQH
jgi:hypothetical protein